MKRMNWKRFWEIEFPVIRGLMWIILITYVMYRTLQLATMAMGKSTFWWLLVVFTTGVPPGLGSLSFGPFSSETECVRYAANYVLKPEVTKWDCINL